MPILPDLEIYLRCHPADGTWGKWRLETKNGENGVHWVEAFKPIYLAGSAGKKVFSVASGIVGKVRPATGDSFETVRSDIYGPCLVKGKFWVVVCTSRPFIIGVLMEAPRWGYADGKHQLLRAGQSFPSQQAWRQMIAQDFSMLNRHARRCGRRFCVHHHDTVPWRRSVELYAEECS